MSHVVFVPERIASGGVELLSRHCEVVMPRAGEAVTGIPTDAEAVLVRLFRVGQAELAGTPKLKVIAKHGAGLDNIDVEAATARRIPVVYTPEANLRAVAEHTIALMLALARKIAPAAAAVAGGRFAERDRYQGFELAGRTLGIVGIGRIGRTVAEIAGAGLGMVVAGHDPLVAAERWPAGVRRLGSVRELFAASDVIALHIPLTAETRHLVDARTFAAVKPGCLIVNTSRGAVIDEAALVDALVGGRIGGAALDVFETEPLPAGHPLIGAPNTLLTPHIASSTAEALERMAVQAAEGILDVLSGRTPRFLANPEVLP